MQIRKYINRKTLKLRKSRTYNVRNEDAILLHDDAKSKAVTGFLDKVGSDGVVNVVVVGRFITKDNKADHWWSLTQGTDCILVSHIFQTLTTDLHRTHSLTTCWQNQTANQS